MDKVPVGHIMSIPGLSDDERIAILGGTAAKLLGLQVYGSAVMSDWEIDQYASLVFPEVEIVSV